MAYFTARSFKSEVISDDKQWLVDYINNFAYCFIVGNDIDMNMELIEDNYFEFHKLCQNFKWNTSELTAYLEESWFRNVCIVDEFNLQFLLKNSRSLLTTWVLRFSKVNDVYIFAIKCDPSKLLNETSSNFKLRIDKVFSV